MPTDQKIELLNNKALPSLNVAYLLNHHVTLFGNYNSSFGAVQNTQLNAQSSKNPLQPELAKTAELGARWKSDQLSAEATLFNIKFDNQIQSVGSGENVIFYNVGATHHRGLETAIDYHFDQVRSAGRLERLRHLHLHQGHSAGWRERGQRRAVLFAHHGHHRCPLPTGRLGLRPVEQPPESSVR